MTGETFEYINKIICVEGKSTRKAIYKYCVKDYLQTLQERLFRKIV